MTKLASELSNLIKSLQQKRYPVVLVLQWETDKLTAQDVDAVSVECCLRRINYREDVLEKNEGNIILGAYLRGHFTEWLLEQARTTKGLIVEEEIRETDLNRFKQASLINTFRDLGDCLIRRENII